MGPSCSPTCSPPAVEDYVRAQPRRAGIKKTSRRGRPRLLRRPRHLPEGTGRDEGEHGGHVAPVPLLPHPAEVR
eukprot:4903582-Pyramimonas_sp.AAC.3